MCPAGLPELDLCPLRLLCEAFGLDVQERGGAGLRF